MLFSGCTPESPPLKPLLSSDESAETQSSVQSSVTDVSLDEHSKTGSVVSEPSVVSSVPESSGDKVSPSGSSQTESSPDKSVIAESSSESSADAERIVGKPVWDDNMGTLSEAAFRYERNAATDYYMSDDVQMMQRLTQALKNVVVISEAQERVYNDTLIIILNTDKQRYMFRFEHGMLVCNGKTYNVSGYEALQEVLNDIEAAYPEWKTKYDEWIHRMSRAELIISELTLSDSYKNAGLEQRKKMALDVLESLNAAGYIKTGTISVSDDSISFAYDCGDSEVLGGIMLKEFDPMMN